LPNESAGASRTFVTSPVGESIIAGYYSIAAGSVDHDSVTGRLRRNMPRPIPAVVLGRLAVDERYQGHGLGSSLVRDAVVRSVAAAAQIGIRAMLVHALNEKAAEFYERLGFTRFPSDSLTCAVPIKDLRRTLDSI
jgi:predicted N-acetyltransferase YhbS